MGIETSRRVSSVGHAGYNVAAEKTWAGRPFWERSGGEYLTSHTIDVWDEAMAVKVIGLPCDGKIVVQLVVGCNEGTHFGDWYHHGKLVCLYYKHNHIVIPFDGRYRLRLVGCEPNDIIVSAHRTGIPLDFARLLR